MKAVLCYVGHNLTAKLSGEAVGPEEARQFFFFFFV